ncbi:hypothetical protein NQ318_018950 [Aromia moschata]|uniref:Carboxylesterase type B domain-containing protein n=1 Tax=Aromia moschata TaxID=1265417 RepID=A0AAV8ZJD2_9CUCU|nr:hypothetical protein NQ318_018950 [Aromia moschata]
MVIEMEGCFPTVTVSQGQLKGEVRSDYKGGKYYCFLGIPYAKPPIGDLRFKAPVPAEPWSGVRDATKEGDMCYNRDQFLNQNVGSEDCLVLNIFVKKSCQKPKPVMVWIHGGAFTSGTGNTLHCGPDFLMTQHIVLVTINYRLGVLGFLCLEDVSLGVPGNAGLKDQALALKWVRDNIASFEGDANNITIFGESAGSASCHLHVLSPTGKGNFHKAILQSASALDYWVWSRRDTAREVAKHLGYAKCGCKEREILELLTSAPMEALYEAQLKVIDSFVPSIQRPFGAVIEKPNETAFITRPVADIILSGDYNRVPIIFGYNTTEGILSELMYPMKSEKERLEVKTDIPFQVKVEGEKAETLCKKMYNLYFGNGYSIEKELEMHTDSIFLAGIMGALVNHVKTNQHPIFLYRLSYVGGLNFLKNFSGLHNIPGVFHADDLGYIFKTAITPPIDPGGPDEVTVQRIVRMWTNFAKCDRPLPDPNEFGVAWLPVKEGNTNFLDIGSQLVAGVDPDSERMALWKEIFQSCPETKNFM